MLSSTHDWPMRLNEAKQANCGGRQVSMLSTDEKKVRYSSWMHAALLGLCKLTGNGG